MKRILSKMWWILSITLGHGVLGTLLEIYIAKATVHIRSKHSTRELAKGEAGLIEMQF